MKIGKFDLDKNILIIAEIGNNHEGSYALAEEMIGLAKESGVGAVKFQTIVPEKLVSASQKERIKQLEKFQLKYEQFEKLKKVADSLQIIFLSTPFDIDSAIFLKNLVPAYKIASGDNNFYPLIKIIADTGKPIILSGGLTDINQLKYTKKFIENCWNEQKIKQSLAILHCVTSYPVTSGEANLSSIPQLKNKLKCTIGYSDHTVGINASVIAVALGARIIEKHFTINKNYSDFRDHKLSADSNEMALLVEKIKETTTLIGNKEKDIQNCEKNYLQSIRRSIVCKRDLFKGHILTWDDITWVRPAGGFSPGQENLILGKTLKKNITVGNLILPEILE